MSKGQPPTTAEEIRAAIREGREFLQDLKRATREAEAQIKVLRDQEWARERVGEQVAQGLADYQATLAQALEEATAAMYERFDVLSKMMLTGDKRGRGEHIVQTAVRQGFVDLDAVDVSAAVESTRKKLTPGRRNGVPPEARGTR